MHASTPTLRFRAATEADIPALVELVTCAYRGQASRAGWTTEADLLDGPRIDPQVLAADIARPRSMVLLAERGIAPATAGAASAADTTRAASSDGAHALLACAHVAEDDGAGYFGMFAVRPDLQGAGVGKALLAEAERLARDDWQLPAMRMTVIDIRDSLIAFYERRGYIRTGIHKPFPYGDERFGIPLRQDLRFEVLEKDLAREASA